MIVKHNRKVRARDKWMLALLALCGLLMAEAFVYLVVYLLVTLWQLLCRN